MPEYIVKSYMQANLKKVLFLVPYPVGHAPSQRFRVELFLPELEKAGISYKVQSFLDERTWKSLYKGGGFFSKAWGVMRGYVRRWRILLFGLGKFDYVFIHRETAPLGPPVFEWFISKLRRKKIIFDFDDAIWLPNTSKENFFISWIKAFWKVKFICKWAYKVAGGNDYLCAYARKYNRNVIRIPTTVDTVQQHNTIKEQLTDKIVVGWTGSHSTMKFLDDIVPVLSDLEKDFDYEFVVISNKAPEFSLKGLRFVPWKEETEVADLLEINIGVMPLENDAWGEGKCGFKLIQYLSLGIPAVASPVGVNKIIIEEGRNGYLCETNTQWKHALKELMNSAEKRKQMGLEGRKKVEEEYSLKSQSSKFVSLFS
jgi:glycosyltransferase involved in cell wall biosynthesis